MNKGTKKEIRSIPGDEGWWDSGGEEVAMEVAEEMLKMGVRDAAVVDWISRLYFAVAAQYGE